MHELVEVTFKILLTVFLSSIIGAERELRQKVAGLKTHILVGVGSALIVVTSLHILRVYGSENRFIDPTRMITGIVTGIGFLCAGAIMQAGPYVKGLTTAATLWIVSGIGIAVGAGDYGSAIIVTIVVNLVMIGVRSIEHKLGEKLKDLHHNKAVD